MKIPSIILMSAVLLGCQSAIHGYRQVIDHNNNRFWSSQPANSYRFHYSNHGSNRIRNSFHGLQTQTSNPRWNHLLYSPMKTSWHNEVMKPRWQNKNTSSKWQNQMLKNKFRSGKSKPQYPKNTPPRPPSGGHVNLKPKSWSRANAAAQREWPEYIPPITMIKLPKDTPPDP